MKRIVKRRRLNQGGDKKLSLYIESSVATKAEAAASFEGFPYFVALLQVLLSLWTRRRVTKSLKRLVSESVSLSRTNWENAAPATKARRTFRIRRDIFDAASKKALLSGMSGVGELARILVELYAQKRLGFVLRTGSGTSAGKPTPDEVTDDGSSQD